jgi:hypothetical protein
VAELGSLASANDSPLPLHSRHQQTNVERSQRVDCVIHRLTQQTFGQL